MIMKNLKDKNLSYSNIFTCKSDGGGSSFQDHNVNMDGSKTAVDGQDPNENHQNPKGVPEESSRIENNREYNDPETDESKLETFILSI
jgi:hypothetical protein